MSKRETIGVTGDAGFIGTAFTAEISGELMYVGMDKHWGKSQDIREYRNLQEEFLPLESVDDPVVVHLAAEASVDADWPQAFKNNCVGTLNVAEYCREHDARLINVSSVAARHPHTSAYAMSKWIQEVIVSRYDIDSTTIRLPNVVGPGHRKGNVRHMIREGVNEGVVRVWYDGEGLRSYVSAETVATTLHAVARGDVTVENDLTHIDGADLTTREVGEIVADELREVRDEEIPVVDVDNEAASPKELTVTGGIGSPTIAEERIREQVRTYE
mgnify:CR=1 FL=1